MHFLGNIIVCFIYYVIMRYGYNHLCSNLRGIEIIIPLYFCTEYLTLIWPFFFIRHIDLHGKLMSNRGFY